MRHFTSMYVQDEDMAMADDYDAGLYEGDIALTLGDIAEMYGLDTVSSHTCTPSRMYELKICT